MSSNSLNKLGVLGPEFSYSDLASNLVSKKFTKVYCKNILECFRKVRDRELDYSLVPLENILNGMVAETIDALSSFSRDIKILDSCVLKIEHHLGVKPEFDSKLEEIKTLYSHPQASSQSVEFIDSELTGVTLIETTSTSEAVRLMLESKEKNTSAIASVEALRKFNAKIFKKIPFQNKNSTRFILISRIDSPDLNETFLPDHSKKHITSFCINPRSDRQGLLLEILDIISKKYQCNLSSIHSRPDKEGGFIFFFEIEGSIDKKNIKDCLLELENFCLNETGGRAYLSLLGSYKKETFQGNKIKKISIIGGHGAMGLWLKNFFSKSNIEVILIDLETSIEGLNDSDVVIFSVPMNKVNTSALQYKDFINPKALVVENCSVKENCLTELIKIFGETHQVLGIHTMFGPSVKSIKGLNIIITEVKNSSLDKNELSKEFIDLFYKEGAKITKASITDHDKAVALLQGLIQFNSFLISKVINDNYKDIKSLKAFLTPNSISILTSIEKFLNQSEDLVYDIQLLNPEARKIRSGLQKTVKELVESLENKKEFSNLFSDSRDKLLDDLRFLLKDYNND